MVIPLGHANAASFEQLKMGESTCLLRLYQPGCFLGVGLKTKYILGVANAGLNMGDVHLLDGV